MRARFVARPVGLGDRLRRQCAPARLARRAGAHGSEGAGQRRCRRLGRCGHGQPARHVCALADAGQCPRCRRHPGGLRRPSPSRARAADPSAVLSRFRHLQRFSRRRGAGAARQPVECADAGIFPAPQRTGARRPGARRAGAWFRRTRVSAGQSRRRDVRPASARALHPRRRARGARPAAAAQGFRSGGLSARLRRRAQSRRRSHVALSKSRPRRGPLPCPEPDGEGRT